MKKVLTLFSFCLGLAVAACAQPNRVLADKVVAVVGDKILLQSDISNQIDDAKRQGAQLPPDAECILLEQSLVRKVLAVQAEKDSLVINEDEIEAELDQRIRYFISQFGSKEELEKVAGKTVYQIKDDSREAIREQKLAEAMQRKIVEGVKVTPAEVKAYYAKIPPDSLAYYESELEVCEIILYPKASREFERLAMDELLEYKRQVEAGEKKFEVLAGLYTDDPGSKETGGRYELNRGEKTWDPIFMAAAFRLKEGQVSPVFKTKFGYHIIQMVSRAGDDAVVRHILRTPKITEAEVALSVTKLDSIRNQLKEGKLDFGVAVSKYSDEDGAKFTGGCKTGPDGSTFITIDKLDKGTVLALKDIKVKDYSAPTPFEDERGRKGVRLVYLRSRTEPHRENLRDDYSRVAQRALEEKKLEALDTWFEQHIPNYYIMIDTELHHCKQLERWLPKPEGKKF